MAITSIFLDLGQVTVGLDRERCVGAFASLGVPDVGEMITNSRQGGFFDGIELGYITLDQFHSNVRRDYGIDVTDEEIDRAWNAFILHTPRQLTDTLKRLRRRYATYVLSNTNQIHYDYWADVCMRSELGVGVEECFSKCYLSHQLHMVKPDEAIYRAVLTDCGARPDECLYLDDNERNIASARSLGWHAVLCKTPEEAVRILKNFEKDEDL